MDTIISEHLDALANTCRRFYVARLELFASATTDAFDPDRSDLDLLVTFSAIPGGNRFSAFFELQRALAELFARPVDLVEEGAPTNPFFIRR